MFFLKIEKGFLQLAKKKCIIWQNIKAFKFI